MAAGTTTQGSLNVNGALLVSEDITSTSDIACSGVLTTQLTVSGAGSSIPGYLAHAIYTQTTESRQFTASIGTWSPWSYPFSEHMQTGNPGHRWSSGTPGVNVVASETTTYLKQKTDELCNPPGGLWVWILRLLRRECSWSGDLHNSPSYLPKHA